MSKLILYDNRTEESKRSLYNKLKELEPAEYVIEIKKNKPVRAIAHNKYYRVVLKYIAVASGEYDEDRLHELMKLKFNYEVVNTPRGGAYIIPGSTSKLSTEEFADFVSKVKMWAKDEYGVIIPERQDVDYLRWMEINNTYNKTFSGY